MVRFVAVAAFSLLASSAFAQDERICKDVSDDEVSCSVTVAGVTTDIQPTLYKFGEGVVHAPGSELAWLVVSNFDAVPVTVTVRFLVQGSTQIVTHQITAPPRTRQPYEIHNDTALAGLKTFSTRVYSPGETDISLVLRPTTDPFARTILPPVDVVRPH